MITMTDAASAQLAKALGKRGKGVGIKIGVTTRGCSGMSYSLEFVDKPAEEDKVFEKNGSLLYAGPKDLPYLDGMKLDFVKEGLQEGFKFDNPHAKETCGCGESFYI